jgi:hypothetical protein
MPRPVPPVAVAVAVAVTVLVPPVKVVTVALQVLDPETMALERVAGMAAPPLIERVTAVAVAAAVPVTFEAAPENRARG